MKYFEMKRDIEWAMLLSVDISVYHNYFPADLSVQLIQLSHMLSPIVPDSNNIKLHNI